MSSHKTFDVLIRKCVEQDNISQHELYEMFSSQMFSICMRYTKNKSIAEDVFQDAFMKVFENLNSIKNPEALPGWIKSIFVRTAILSCKLEKRKYWEVEITPDKHENYEPDSLEKMSHKEILLLITGLPKKCKLVFNLYVIEGYSHAEIADLMGISVGTSKSQLFDARKILMNKINDQNRSYLKLVI